jgi:putative PIG3 family NAD(P)H quinone oxidoreductase
MRCAVIKRFGKEIRNLVIEEREDLVATGEFVRVRVMATALNRADLLQRRGLYPAPPDAPQDVPGLEFVGYIDRVGEAVTGWRGGERVFGVVSGGSYGDQLLTHQGLIVAVPERLSEHEAAAVPEAFMVAHDALMTQGEMQPGDLVLVHSVAGGLGSAAAQLVHAFGGRAVGTAGSGDKLAAVARLAPVLAVNYRTEDFHEKVVNRFGGNAVAVILDTVGAPYWKRNLDLLKVQGRLILLGMMGGAQAETPLATLLAKRLRLMGSTLRQRPLAEKIAVTRAFAKGVLPLLEQGIVKPVVDSVFPFAKLHEATARMENNENMGKIVLSLM